MPFAQGGGLAYSYPGCLEGGERRKRAGLVQGGPSVVVTTMGVMRFRPTTKTIFLASYHPSLSPETSAENTGFPLDVEGAVQTPIPNPEELRILREQVDPERVFLN